MVFIYTAVLSRSNERWSSNRKLSSFSSQREEKLKMSLVSGLVQFGNDHFRWKDDKQLEVCY